MAEFECPKPKTGVLCCNCKYNKICPPLHPPKPNLRPRHSTSDQLFQPIPVEIPKWHYRLLLLISEDFYLTKPEIRDVVFYSTRFQPFAKNGGRGKSWERVLALTCIEILCRDKRVIYTNNKSYFDKKYKLQKPDTRELQSFVKKEIERINETIPVIRGFKQATKAVRRGRRQEK